MNPFTDKYFSKTKRVLEVAGVNPLVGIRVYPKFAGLAAFKPAADFIKTVCPSAKVDYLPEGTPFKSKDTGMIIYAKAQDIVEYETNYLQFFSLPAYCAGKMAEIVEAADGRPIMAFEARHLSSPIGAALSSYGAKIGGATAFSTDVGANALVYLNKIFKRYKNAEAMDFGFTEEGKGTTPHFLLACLHGDYEAACKAYAEAFPDDDIIQLIDYNNREIKDTLTCLRVLGDKLKAVRADTCGENRPELNPFGSIAQRFDYNRGVTPALLAALRDALNANGGEHVKIIPTSGFNLKKTRLFMEEVPDCVDAIGTGSFIPPGYPQATADIFEVDGEQETKVGREWGFERNEHFYAVLKEQGDAEAEL